MSPPLEAGSHTTAHQGLPRTQEVLLHKGAGRRSASLLALLLGPGGRHHSLIHSFICSSSQCLSASCFWQRGFFAFRRNPHHSVPFGSPPPWRGCSGLYGGVCLSVRMLPRGAGLGLEDSFQPPVWPQRSRCTYGGKGPALVILGLVESQPDDTRQPRSMLLSPSGMCLSPGL